MHLREREGERRKSGGEVESEGIEESEMKLGESCERWRQEKEWGWGWGGMGSDRGRISLVKV